MDAGQVRVIVRFSPFKSHCGNEKPPTIMVQMKRRSILAFLGMPALAICGLSSLVSPAVAEETDPGDSTSIGIAKGERAPAFRLKQAGGEEVSLEDLLKKGTVALVFYRSADW